MRRIGGVVVAVVALVSCSSSSRSAVRTETSPVTDTASVTTVEPAGPVDRDEFGDPVDAPPLLPPEKQAIIDALDPAADCADDATASLPAVGDGQVAVQAVRAVGDCLVVETTVVAAADYEAAVAEREAQPDVVGVGEATTIAVDERVPAGPDPDQGEQQWWLDDLRVGELDALPVDPAAPKVRVAVIDTGIDDSHPDLAAAVVGRAPWAGAPNGSGAGDSSHGTHVAGIIAAVAGNGVAGRGVARGVELLDASANGASVSQAIDWAVDHGADVINMSFCEIGLDGRLPCRATPSGATAASIAYARSRGVMLFASSGNCGPDNYAANPQCGKELNRVVYPAQYNAVIAVGAYGHDGDVAGFSSRNITVDVSAPGDAIISTVFGGTVGSKSGTSMASPMVAGAAAALLAHRPDVNPGRIYSGVFAIVRDAGASGWDPEYGNGRIDPLTVAQRLDASAPPPATTLPSAFPLANGDAGDEVKAVQAALATAGYDVGGADGEFGPRTEAAVRAFQADEGMDATGQVDQALFDLAQQRAAQAPGCDASLMRAAATPLQQYWLWDEQPWCVTGWAILSAWLPDSAASEHHLFRVRGDRWVEVRWVNGREVTTILAEGTPLSVRGFSEYFGTVGWPGRVSNPDQVAQFIMEDAVNQAYTLPGAWELVGMWLDADGMDVWLTWLYESSTTGTLGACVRTSGGVLPGDHYECTWLGDDGLIWVVIVDLDLTTATMVPVD